MINNNRKKYTLIVAVIILMGAALFIIIDNDAENGWETFNSSEFGFSLDYPEEHFELNTFTPRGGLSNFYLNEHGKEFPLLFVTVNRASEYKGDTIEAIFEEFITRPVYLIDRGDELGDSLENIERTNFQGKEAYSYELKDDFDGSVNYMFLHKSHVINFNILLLPEYYSESMDGIRKQVIDSIKFI